MAIANAGPLYRDAVDELMGGKTPESLKNRAELNEIDTMGLDAVEAQQMVERMKDMMLEEKVSSRGLPHRGYPHHGAPHLAAHHPGSILIYYFGCTYFCFEPPIVSQRKVAYIIYVSLVVF